MVGCHVSDKGSCENLLPNLGQLNFLLSLCLLLPSFLPSFFFSFSLSLSLSFFSILIFFPFLTLEEKYLLNFVLFEFISMIGIFFPTSVIHRQLISSTYNSEKTFWLAIFTVMRRHHLPLEDLHCNQRQETTMMHLVMNTFLQNITFQTRYKFVNSVLFIYDWAKCDLCSIY